MQLKKKEHVSLPANPNRYALQINKNQKPMNLTYHWSLIIVIIH